MKNVGILAFSVLALTVQFAGAEDRGHCPGFLHHGKASSFTGREFHPPKTKEPAEKPSPGAEYLGRVMLSTAVSDTGIVCDAEVDFGIDQKIDQEVLQRFKSRRFPPVVQNGKSVPVNVTVSVHVWRKSDGQLVEFPEPKLPKL